MGSSLLEGVCPWLVPGLGLFEKGISIPGIQVTLLICMGNWCLLDTGSSKGSVAGPLHLRSLS